MSGTVISLFAMLSGFIVAYIIYALSIGGQFSNGRLILVGIGVQAMVTATISFLMLNASQYDIPAAMRWLSGSLNGIQLSQISALGIVILVFDSLLLSLHRPLK